MATMATMVVVVVVVSVMMRDGFGSRFWRIGGESSLAFPGTDTLSLSLPSIALLYL
jgi:hypothetical protein